MPEMNLINIVGGLLLGLLAWWSKDQVDRQVARTDAKAKDGELELKWVQELRAEIEVLRREVADLRTHLEAKDRIAWMLGDFLDELSAFVHYGHKGRYPNPPEGAAEAHYNRGRWLEIKKIHDRRMSQQNAQEQIAPEEFD